MQLSMFEPETTHIHFNTNNYKVAHQSDRTYVLRITHKGEVAPHHNISFEDINEAIKTAILLSRKMPEGPLVETAPKDERGFIDFEKVEQQLKAGLNPFAAPWERNFDGDPPKLGSNERPADRI